MTNQTHEGPTLTQTALRITSFFVVYSLNLIIAAPFFLVLSLPFVANANM